MRHCLVMADKGAKLPSLVNNLIANQGVSPFLPFLMSFFMHETFIRNYDSVSFAVRLLQTPPQRHQYSLVLSFC